MSESPVYLDFAATSAIRPAEVGDAVASYIGSVGATPGRGSYKRSTDAGRVALRCRMALARLLGIPGDPGRMAWMLNATHAINTALYGVLRRDDVLVTTTFDHNAVIRPAHRLAEQRQVRVRTVHGDTDGSIDMRAVSTALDNARVLVINAASNVLGTSLPIAELAHEAHERGAIVLVDAAQLAGHGELNAGRDGIDMLAFTGHKGLLGPQGTGGLWVREGLAVDPLLTGGTGGNSLNPEMPDAFPDHLEAGTQNAPGIAGLLAGVEWIERRTVPDLQRHGAALKLRLWDGLASIRGVRILSPRVEQGVPIVTVVSDVLDPSTMAQHLDATFGISARAGLHCAPEVHRMLGSADQGALRFSTGWCTTEEEIDRTIAAVDQIIGAAKSGVSWTAPAAPAAATSPT
jgi:cysteine desulfurase / selenocysteine lyase